MKEDKKTKKWQRDRHTEGTAYSFKKEINQNPPTKKAHTNKPNEPQQPTTALHAFPKITLETRAATKVSEINFIG